MSELCQARRRDNSRCFEEPTHRDDQGRRVCGYHAGKEMCPHCRAVYNRKRSFPALCGLCGRGLEPRRED